LPTDPTPAGIRHPGGCLQPVLLRGRVDHIDGATGELLHRYTTVHEPGGVLPIACKTRRSSRCPPCAEVYRADTYQLIRAGLSGGKGVPETVATHPCVFTTLTAPSFGPVHVFRERDGRVLRCRPRRHGGLDTGTVRVRAAYAERSNGEIVLGPPKSKASRRIVGIPRVIVPDLRHHLAAFAEPGPGALAFPGARGGPLRRGNFNRSAAWPQAVAAIGAPGLHFHDLRHTGNTFAAASGAGLRDLMARMGHDSERAALIYQHEARGADAAITDAIDAHVDAERARDHADDGTMIPAG